MAKKKRVVKAKPIRKKKTVKRKKKVAKKKEKNPVLEAAIKGLEEKKGKKIVLLDLKSIPNRVADYFLICEGDSRTQTDALAHSVEAYVKKETGTRPYHSEGFENSEWILIDYITLVVHIFQPDIRARYNLEGIWGDAEIRRIVT